MNSDRWGISTRIRRSRTGTELLANFCTNLGKQCLQGVLNGRRKLGVGYEMVKWLEDQNMETNKCDLGVNLIYPILKVKSLEPTGRNLRL
uniref:Uncharacterized protein n=1 Tax=Tanacetum cinerariifolium TaxID=118510 RepID=A0A699TE12_TANCI|nr:hypothetical protein [Tanacetum cinerariifolium]